nr:glutathione S-transferase sigma 9 [Brachionus rubens]
MTETSSERKFVLNYFNKHGKVELSRLIFQCADVKYEDNFIENYTDSDTSLGFMPFLQVNDVKIPLISVICRYLAKEFNLAGDDHLDQAKTDAIAQTVMLLIDTYYRNVFNIEDIDTKKINLKDYLNNDVESAADTVENLINMYSNKGDWCVGNKCSYADLFVYEMAKHYFPSDPQFMERFPMIYKIRQNVEEKSNVSDYVKTKAYQKSKVEREF